MSTAGDIALLATVVLGALAALRAVLSSERRRGVAEAELLRRQSQDAEAARLRKVEATIDAETDAAIARRRAEHPPVEQPTEADAERLIARARKEREP